MESLYALATELEVDDEIRWVGKNADIINFHNVELNVIDDVRRNEDRITLEATGPRGAEVGFWVDKGGDSQVFHQGSHKEKWSKRKCLKRTYTTWISDLVY